MKQESNNTLLAGPFQPLSRSCLLECPNFPYVDTAIVVAIPDNQFIALTDSEGFIKKIRKFTTVVDFDESVGLIAASEYVVFAPLVPHQVESWNSERPCTSCPEDGPNCLLCYRRRIMANVALRKEIRNESQALLKKMHNDSFSRPRDEESCKSNGERIIDSQDGYLLRSILTDELKSTRMSINKLISFLESYGEA